VDTVAAISIVRNTARRHGQGKAIEKETGAVCIWIDRPSVEIKRILIQNALTRLGFRQEIFSRARVGFL